MVWAAGLHEVGGRVMMGGMRLTGALLGAVVAVAGCGDEVYEPADVEALGVVWEAEWDDPDAWCRDMQVDMAGFTKVVCGLPAELQSPSTAGEGIAIQGFEEASEAEEFREMFLAEGDGWVQGEGWFVIAPNQDIADVVEGILNR